MYITTVILDHFRLKWWRPNFFSQSFGVPKGSSSWITGGLQVQKAMVLIYNGDEKYFLKKSHLKRVFPRILTHGVFEVLKCLVRTTGRGSCFFKNILWTLNIEWNLWVVVPTHVCYIYPQSDSPMCWGCGRTRWEANWSGLGLPACEVCSKMRLIFCILHIAPWSWTFSIDEVEMEKDKSEDVWVPFAWRFATFCHHLSSEYWRRSSAAEAVNSRGMQSEAVNSRGMQLTVCQSWVWMGSGLSSTE